MWLLALILIALMSGALHRLTMIDRSVRVAAKHLAATRTTQELIYDRLLDMSLIAIEQAKTGSVTDVDNAEGEGR